MGTELCLCCIEVFRTRMFVAASSSGYQPEDKLCCYACPHIYMYLYTYRHSLRSLHRIKSLCRIPTPSHLYTRLSRHQHSLYHYRFI